MRTVEFVLLLFLASAKSLEEGDDCNLTTGQKGTCLSMHDCAFAKELLKNQQHPDTCGFEKNHPLVCCIRASSRILRKPGVLSAEKCVEYYPRRKRPYIILAEAKRSLAQEFPHMAAIGFGERNSIHWQCGGSLISPKFILTAAHCLKSPGLGEAKFVRLGDLDLANDTDETEPQDFNVKRTIAHPEFKKPSKYHDIGLIELDRNVNLTKFVGMACLDTRREHNEKHMTVTGWGNTEFVGNPSSHLLKAEFNIVPHNVCRIAYKRTSRFLSSGILDDVQICAGGTRDQDTCNGDSGGPLQVQNIERSRRGKVYNIVGVTSFGKACGLSDVPGVYTRVFNYLSWIESIVWPFS